MIAVNLHKPILTEYNKVSKNFISFRGEKQEDSVEFNLDLDLDSLTNENGKPRFNKEEKAEIIKRIKPFNKKTAKMLINKQDKNTSAVFSLIYEEERVYDCTRLMKKDIEKNYVKPAFNAKEICNILDAVNKTNIEFVEELTEAENTKIKNSIKPYFNKYKNLGSETISKFMKKRKELAFKYPDSKRIFRKEVAAYDSYGITEILNNIDENNNVCVRMLINRKGADDNARFSAEEVCTVLKTISELKKKDKLEPQTIGFLDYLIDLEDMNCSAPRFNSEEISMLLKVHSNNTKELKKLIEEPETKIENIKLSQEEMKNINFYLENKQFSKIQKTINKKNNYKNYRYNAKQIAKKVTQESLY